MHWLGFLASLIRSLAWPIAIALFVWWLREPIKKRIEHLRRARLGGQEFEFADAVQDAEAAAAEAALPSSEPTTEDPALSTELHAEIATAPRAAVIEAWLAVELELENLATKLGLDTGHWPAPERLVGELVKQGVAESALVPVIVDLRRARNLAVHGRPYIVDRDEVREYVKLAGRVRSALRLAGEALEAQREGETMYDLFVYHDLHDPTMTTGGSVPSVGDAAERWFGAIGRERHVVAVGPGVHPGRVTVVLAHGDRPMTEVQELLNRLPHE